MRIATDTAAHTSATNIVPLRSSIAAGVRHKPSHHIEVTTRTCHQKRCATILLAHEKQYTSIMRIATATAAHTSATDIGPLRSSIAAGVRHKPPRHIEVTIRTCQQKRRPTILLAHENPYTSVVRIAISSAAHNSATDIVPLRSSIAAGVRYKPLRHIDVTIRATILLAHEKPYTSVRRIATATAAHASATNIVPLRSSIAASVRHKPPRHIDVTVRTCQQKRRPTILLAHEKPYTSITRIATATAAHTSATDIVPLRSSIAAGV
jgi:hypothetical protein